MDDKLLRRIQAGGASLVVIAYFLPWASILTPLNTIQVRGVYIDYSWVLLLLGVGHLAAQFTETNSNSLGVPESWIHYVRLFSRYSPIVLLGLLFWYGASFMMSSYHGVDGGRRVMGVEVSTLVKSGLDYGFWLGLVGSIGLLIGTGLITRKLSQLGSIALFVMAICIGIAFGTRYWAQTGTATQNDADGGAVSKSQPNARSAPSSTRTKSWDIVSVDSKVTESNSVWSRFAWKLTVKNNGDQPLRLEAQIEFQDNEGFIVDTDGSNNLVLKPKHEETFTGQKLITAASVPRVARTVAKVQER